MRPVSGIHPEVSTSQEDESVRNKKMRKYMTGHWRTDYSQELNVECMSTDELPQTYSGTTWGASCQSQHRT